MKTNESIKETNELFNERQQLPEPPAELNIDLPEDEEGLYCIMFVPLDFLPSTATYGKNLLNTLRKNIGYFNIANSPHEIDMENIIALKHKPSDELMNNIVDIAVNFEINLHGFLHIVRLDHVPELDMKLPKYDATIIML